MKEAIKNLNIRTKLISGILALSLATGAGIYGGYKLKKDTRSDIPQDSIGVENVNPLINSSNDLSKFVVLDVGDHDSYGVLFQKEKIEYCNDKDITLGIVISTDADNEDKIYDDVEYVKGLVDKYKITFPVYLEIDKIIENDNLNNESKSKIIKDFLEKCSANNIYVGVKGTDTNLSRMKKYCDITGYDAFLVMDKEEIEYDGTYNVVKDMDGNITSKVNIREAIEKKKLNNASKFSNDKKYTIKENDDITDIAMKYGLSVNELLGYNDLNKDELEPGITLKIPSIIETETKDNNSFEILDEPIRGCDISYAQGKNINWDKISDNFEYVILRVSQGLNKDEYFETNAKNCNLNDIPIGVYCYNAYNDTNCEDIEEFIKRQTEQVEYVISNLKNKKIEYPVYLDIEESNITDKFTKKQVQEMLKIWTSKVSEAGYIPGIYCNQSGYRFLQSCVDYKISDAMQLWISGGDQYSSEKQDYDL